GLEVASVLVPGRPERRGTPARRRAAVRGADGRDHRRDPVEPRRNGVAPRRGGRADREGGSLGRRGRRSMSYADASTRRVGAGNGIEYAYRDLGAGDVPLVL